MVLLVEMPMARQTVHGAWMVIMEMMPTPKLH